MENGSFSDKRLRWLLVVDGDLDFPQNDGLSVGDGGRYCPSLSTAAYNQRGSQSKMRQRVQLSLNSFGSIFFSLIPSARDGLLEYGLRVSFESWEAGRAFSSLTSVPLTTGPLREVNGSRNGGMSDGMWALLMGVHSILVARQKCKLSNGASNTEYSEDNGECNASGAREAQGWQPTRLNLGLRNDLQGKRSHRRPAAVCRC